MDLLKMNALDVGRYISDEYRDLNGDTIEVLDEPPTAIEFSRLVHISRPVVIKGFTFPALQKWNKSYLRRKMDGHDISIAVTPTGRADALEKHSDDITYFVEPWVEKMSVGDLLDRLDEQDTGEVYYLQSQNGNLFSAQSFTGGENPTEFAPLTEDVPSDVSWVSEALGNHPDAVNIWIGNDSSVTSIHNDPYENLYTVIQGQKEFFLLPPTDSLYLKEKYYRHARYSRNDSGRLELYPSEAETPPIRWSSVVDPETPDAFPPFVTPVRIVLNAGETLYLPVGWWHYVRQSGFTVAVNWWYDAELRGLTWVLLNFLRNTTRVEDGA